MPHYFAMSSNDWLVCCVALPCAFAFCLCVSFAGGVWTGHKLTKGAVDA